MTQAQAPIGVPGRVRVTVTSDTRRVDLVLPGAVPVAELVPELARCVGMLDVGTVHGGYRLVAPDGRELVGDAGLTSQGVEDGGVIAVVAGVDDEPPRVYDDVVEVMSDVVERDLRTWDAATGRRTSLGAAVLLLLVGAGSLLLQHGSDVAAAAAVAAGIALVLGAIVLSHTRGEVDVAVTVALTGCVYAAVAGLMIGWDTPSSATPVATAGGAALAAGLVAAVGLTERRALLLPPVVVGAVLLATGLLVRASSCDPAVVLTAALALLVIAGSVSPWLALGATGTSMEQLCSTADIAHEPVRIDASEVSVDARVAHEILLAVSATVGVVLVLAAPPAVSLGPPGVAVAVLACVVLMLRTRQYRLGAEVLVGLISAVLGLVSTALSTLWLHPDWRPAVAVALAVTGAVWLALTLLPRPGSVRRGRLADVVETVSMLALVPALVVATGICSWIPG